MKIAIRAKIIYILSHNRGAFWYTNTENFLNLDQHSRTLLKIESEFNRSDDEFIKSFKKKYSNSLPPSWMMMEVSSFGITSNLYSNLVSGKDKREIANYFGLRDKVFASWLHSIVYYRNVCAHHSRLWNREMRIQPEKPKNTTNQWLNNRDISNKKIYFALSIIIYLMNSINPNHTIPQKFNILLEKYANIDPKAMGFPKDWKDEPLWN